MQDGFINVYTVCVFYVHRAGRLTWHDVIPSDEVWIKLGGDKGGETFKMSFPIVNVPRPIVVPKIPVSSAALRLMTTLLTFIALDHFLDQVEELQRIKWRLVQIMFLQIDDFNLHRQYKIKLFLCGDYNFFSTMYGLSGACGALILDVNNTHYD